MGSFSSLSSLKVSVLTGEIHTVEFYLALKRDDAVGGLGVMKLLCILTLVVVMQICNVTTAEMTSVHTKRQFTVC